MKPDFDLGLVLREVEKAIQPYPKAAMFELFEQGYDTLFEQLISCIISIRTLDETTIPVSLRLFEQARTPEQILAIDIPTLIDLLYGTTYPDQKAYTLHGIADRIINEFGGELPADYETLISLKGVGPKCANLALGVATGQAAISVDVHVHRVVNRWGYVQTKQPEQTLKKLEAQVPREQWVNINRLLMPFGKHICTGSLPRCSTCVVLPWCEQVGVERHR
ncbi:endonuclease III domain-containing protein [Spirosoma sp. KUDC1026]|uniref:endonuclease III domain-containing protein n=1 Tax=Spirosoma sp. KUDC1026 TaxID=2745947 RepID=UPI00159BC05E|nr:endonuclease III [Spirosoma sp. KUDC1026]QKZ11349.1 endonuclease III [Spirosoma sp. KUDC1026]